MLVRPFKTEASTYVCFLSLTCYCASRHACVSLTPTNLTVLSAPIVNRPMLTLSLPVCSLVVLFSSEMLWKKHIRVNVTLSLSILAHSSCSGARSSSTRTDITMSTASAVSAVIAHWQMSHSPARMMHCSAMTATVMNSPPSV